MRTTAGRWLMTRRFLNPTTLTRASSTQSSSSSSSSDIVSTNAADVADVIGGDDEEDSPLYPGSADSASSSSVAKPVIPTLLQPRVVVYDGVCHLCHRGMALNFKLSKLGFEELFLLLGFDPIGFKQVWSGSSKQTSTGRSNSVAFSLRVLNPTYDFVVLIERMFFVVFCSSKARVFTTMAPLVRIQKSPFPGLWKS